MMSHRAELQSLDKLPDFARLRRVSIYCITAMVVIGTTFILCCATR